MAGADVMRRGMLTRQDINTMTEKTSGSDIVVEEIKTKRPQDAPPPLSKMDTWAGVLTPPSGTSSRSAPLAGGGFPAAINKQSSLHQLLEREKETKKLREEAFNVLNELEEEGLPGILIDVPSEDEISGSSSSLSPVPLSSSLILSSTPRPLPITNSNEGEISESQPTPTILPPLKELKDLLKEDTVKADIAPERSKEPNGEEDNKKFEARKVEEEKSEDKGKEKVKPTKEGKKEARKERDITKKEEKRSKKEREKEEKAGKDKDEKEKPKREKKGEKVKKDRQKGPNADTKDNFHTAASTKESKSANFLDMMGIRHKRASIMVVMADKGGNTKKKTKKEGKEEKKENRSLKRMSTGANTINSKELELGLAMLNESATHSNDHVSI